MDAARLCQAASRRLGYHFRRSSLAHSRRELRMAQRAVDDSRLAILSAVQMEAATRAEKQLVDLLGALTQSAPAAACKDSVMHQKDSGSQTDHLLRSQVHALALSKGTDNPTQDLVDTFELRLLVAGPELDNSVGIVSCANSAISAKITVKGMNLCFGELFWTSRQLNAGRTVECKLSTAEVLAMSRRITAARGVSALHTADKISAKDWDDTCSEASTTATSSLSCSISAAELSGSECEHTSRSQASQGELAQRRFARARRSARGPADCRKDEVDIVNTADGAHKGLPTVAEEERSRLPEPAERRITMDEVDALHDILKNAQLKTYVFTHNLEWYIRPL
eukprot:TRINITY_DN6262_c0_g1_i1.p1 TRINITY_DN6262_c0_g1~~TRINITY_DN6262_c0_g1_i1.p1  ORF type:complete len:339 (+),score=50.05 TRINITY_DN6262_c0_g1_i1:139-1155(+)